MSTRRIDLSLLDDDLKTLINASAKIIPIPYSYIQSGLNPSNYDYVRVNDTTHKNEIYIWDIDKFTLIGADDYDILWGQIKEKPLTFPPDLHNHDDLYYNKLEVIAFNSNKVDKEIGKGLSTNDFTDEMKDAVVNTVNISDDLNTHVADTGLHVTAFDREELTKISSKADKTYVDQNLATKVAVTTFNGHANNTSIHITQDEKDLYANNLDKNFIHFQTIPRIQWDIVHNLNKCPDVLIMDDLDEVIIGKIVYDDLDNLHIEFTSEIHGKAILN